MCANVDLLATNAFVAKHKKAKTKKIIVYKVVYKIEDNDDKHLASMLYDFKWGAGVHEVKRAAKLQKKNGREINLGFHVYMNKDSALISNDYCPETILQLTVDPKDIICIDNKDYAEIGVFRKVTVTAAAIKKALEY